MNYRHAFHAGNQGDVLKHAVLARILTYFKQKDQAFTVLDAHAGIGRYDLLGIEAFKTGEWRGGIAKLLAAALAQPAAALLQPFLDVVSAVNPDGQLRLYPGSPELALQMIRPQDKLLLNELHPADFATLSARYARYAQVTLTQVDATTAVKAALPFQPRRGIVLVDPAYEASDETERVTRLVAHALRRMAAACLLIWYPVTTRHFADAFCASLDVESARSALRLELRLREPMEGSGLAGSGLVVINPPWTLHDEAQVLLPALSAALGETKDAAHSVSWLLPPR